MPTVIAHSTPIHSQNVSFWVKTYTVILSIAVIYPYLVEMGNVCPQRTYSLATPPKVNSESSHSPKTCSAHSLFIVVRTSAILPLFRATLESLQSPLFFHVSRLIGQACIHDIAAETLSGPSNTVSSKIMQPQVHLCPLFSFQHSSQSGPLEMTWVTSLLCSKPPRDSAFLSRQKPKSLSFKGTQYLF